jgi:hypothetical protein
LDSRESLYAIEGRPPSWGVTPLMSSHPPTAVVT